MSTFVAGNPPEIEAFLARRRELGHDRYDEMWDGVYHVAPEAHVRHGIVQMALGVQLARLAPEPLVVSGPFNLGDGPANFRVPDFGVHEGPPDALCVRTALLVGEVLSPGDETWQKLDFYAGHGVREILVVDPQERTAQLLRLQEPDYPPAEHSDVVGCSLAEIGDIRWP